MTTKDLQNKVSVRPQSYGSYEVIIEFRGKEYRCVSNNSEAYDRIFEDNYMPKRMLGAGLYTYRQALTSFYNECKIKNNLD